MIFIRFQFPDTRGASASALAFRLCTARTPVLAYSAYIAFEVRAVRLPVLLVAMSPMANNGNK